MAWAYETGDWRFMCHLYLTPELETYSTTVFFLADPGFISISIMVLFSLQDIIKLFAHASYPVKKLTQTKTSPLLTT